MNEGPLKSKSYSFAISIVKISQYLQSDKREYILQKQLLRSGTAIGALVSEAQFAQSKADFINKMYVALKEANETVYWLSLLKDKGYIDDTSHDILSVHCKELIAMLASSVKTSKSAMK